MRQELNKKQRQIISLKFDLDDKVYQLESTNTTINNLKNRVNELQINHENERNDYETVVRQSALKQRRMNDEMQILKEEVDRLQRTSQKDVIKSYTITYTEE